MKSLTVKDLAESLYGITLEVIKRYDPSLENLYFGDKSEQTRWTCGHEMYLFGTAIMYLMILGSKEFEPLNQRISAEYAEVCNRFFDTYAKVLHDRFNVPNDHDALAAQFKLRINAYRTAFTHKNVPTVISAVLLLAKSGGHPAADDFLNKYLKNQDVIKDEFYKILFLHSELTGRLFLDMVAIINKSFHSFVSQYTIKE